MAQRRISLLDSCIPEFAELFSISDLHLGGKTGFQIFASGKELERLVKELTARKANGLIAFVINGDFVDFLAEDGSSHFDPQGAIAKLDRIMADPAFEGAWNALRGFVATPGRRLIITLGNHDVELALPWVRAHLLERLAGGDGTTPGDDAARGRIHLAFDGAGFLCRVGNARVLCIHGNDGDDWNVIDHETVRRQGRDILHGRPTEDWVPNAGTKLVIDVMNDVKKKYPFVDLLKPEKQAVLHTLAALDPALVGKLDGVAAAYVRMKRDQVRRAMGFLSTEERPAAQEPPRHRPVSPVDSAALAESMLDEAEARLRSDIAPIDLVADDELNGQLGVSGAIYNLIRRRPTSEVLREVLENLKKDLSFDLRGPDETFDYLDKEVGDTVDIIIAGHTHLQRSIPRKFTSGWYFNSGSWARLIQLTKDILDDAGLFARAFGAFEAGSMDELEKIEGFVLRLPTVVWIGVENGRAVGELRLVSGDGTKDVFSRVNDSRYPKD